MLFIECGCDQQEAPPPPPPPPPPPRRPPPKKMNFRPKPKRPTAPLRCDPSCEKLCLPSCDFTCCIPEALRSTNFAHASQGMIDI